MPPKKAPAKKLHELASEVRLGFKIVAIDKKTYVVGKQFATGGFGRIHTCTEEGKSLQMVMKIEPLTNGPLLTEVVVFNRILKKEMIDIYKKNHSVPWLGLPYQIANGYFTYDNEKMRYLIIPKYAMSLEAAREAKGGALSVKDSLTVANCVLGALEYLHDSDYAHADVKAANILLEKSNDYSSAILVDFGLAHKTTNNVDKPDKKKAHNGTCIFTSTDAHRGNSPSYRGDVEILAYNLIMWISGTLPWLALESTPDKVFDAKQKFIAGLPGTLQNVFTNQPAAVITCVSSMFTIALKTEHTKKVDMVKLKKLVADAIKAPGGGTKSTIATDASRGATPKRKVVPKVESEDEEEVEVEVRPKKTATTRVQKSRRVVNDDEEEEEEEVIIPKPARSSRKPRPAAREEVDHEELPTSSQSRSRKPLHLGMTSSSALKDRTAMKIEQKYKRLVNNKASHVPVTVCDDSSDDFPDESNDPSTFSGVGRKRSSGGECQLKTPALVVSAVKKAKYKSGISSATKASPTELRRVPGVRNFPKGRRSVIIKETSTKYKEKRAAARQTFDDSSCSSEV